jgi:tetratricopeptide (TPR) repeat protein
MEEPVHFEEVDSDDEDHQTEELGRAERFDALKSEANGLFSSGEYERALQTYLDAFDLAESDQQRAIIHANRAAVYLRLNDWASAVAESSEAVELDPTYVKAYYRRAVAHEENKAYDLAIQGMSFSLSLSLSLFLS